MERTHFSDESLPAKAAVRKPSKIQGAGSMPERSVEMARIAYLSRRLAPPFAAIVAELAFATREAAR